MFVVSPTTYMLVLEFPYWSGVDVRHTILGCIMLQCRSVHVRHVMCCFWLGFRRWFRLRSRLWLIVLWLRFVVMTLRFVIVLSGLILARFRLVMVMFRFVIVSLRLAIVCLLVL